MNRRDFIQRLGLGIAVAGISPYLDLAEIVQPVECISLPLSLYGIPYHESNSSSGTWLGFDRATYPWIYSAKNSQDIYNELTNLINQIIESKKVVE